MFEYHQNILCVQGGWLYREASIMTESNYKKLRSKYFKVLRRASRNTPALIDFDSIPERFRKIIIERFGDPRATTKHIHFKDYLVYDTEAQEYFANYTLDSGDALPEKNIKEYVANAIILNAIHKLVNNATARRKAIGGSKSKIWNKLADIIQDLPKHTYPHSLPKNVRRLKDRQKRYLAEGYESLIHKNFCNKNSEKINDDAKLWLLSRWADRVKRVATVAQLHREYNLRAVEYGWKPLKEQTTIYNYLQTNEHLWSSHRYGELKAKEKFTYFHSTKMPSMRDSLWYSDGTKLNYYYIDDNGNVATCQVYMVMDTFSEVFLGYHISKTEDYWAQYFAYKMAVRNSGYKPYQIGFDNQGGHKKLENGDFLTKVARLAIKTQPYNGKSKTIESAFGRFQQQYMKQDWFFTGQNITAKKAESKANNEFIMANKKDLPTLAEVKETFKRRVQEWNEAPHHKTGEPRISMYRNSENPQAVEIKPFDTVDMFWILRDKPVTVSPYGVQFTEKRTKYNFMVYDRDNMPDFDFIAENSGKKVWIKFDPEDMTMVYLYTKDELGLRLLTPATTKIEIHRNKQEQEAHENEWIAKVNEANKRKRIERHQQMEQILADHNATAEDYGLQTPKISGVKSTYKKNKNGSTSDIGEVLKEESNLVPVSNDGSIYDDF